MENYILFPMNPEEFTQALLERLKELITPSFQQTTDSELLSVDQVCKIFKVSRPTVTSWTAHRLLQDHRIGRRIYYKQNEVMAALTKIKRYQRV